MSEYQVIARKWRPQRFSDVVGQEHIIQTLKNAIRMQRTAHAYLFVGPRGVGKTTTARIFAKALNCLNPEDGEPCCKCRSCLAVVAGNNMDVIEIDAASQSGVNDARAIREEAMHMPINGRYKIYIIDEVHMLSKQAWNALLKIVEEPPAHIKFIFATTEVHMVLGTIISRCQRFDLQRISTQTIVERLEGICQAEKVKVSKNAIMAIARAADGGMRDAQSLLDQMISFFSTDDGQEISEEQVLSLFGLSAIAEIDLLITALCTNDRAGVVAAIHRFAAKGKNLETLFSDVLMRLRGIQLCYLVPNPEEILETDAEAVASIRQLGDQTTLETIQILIEQLSSIGRAFHDALNKQVFLESILLKAMREAHAVKIADLLSRLNHLRNAGDLQFIDQVPPATIVPKTTPPAEKIQKPTVPKLETPISPAPQKKSPETVPPTVVEEAPVPAEDPELQAAKTPVKLAGVANPEKLWAGIAEALKENQTLCKTMKRCRPESFEKDVLTVVLTSQDDTEAWQRLNDHLPECNLVLQKLSERPLACINLKHITDAPKDDTTKPRQSMMSDLDALEKARNNSAVKMTIDLFGGDIAEIRK